MIRAEAPVRIIAYNPTHQPIFRALNEEWLDQYGLKEQRDVEVMEDPQGEILDRGGAIYLAEANGEVVGTAALMKEDDGVYELVKMGVAGKWRGRGVSKLLLEACLAKARALKAKKVILFSNSKLKIALGLYEKYGFRHVPLEDSPFETADIKMELLLE